MAKIGEKEAQRRALRERAARSIPQKVAENATAPFTIEPPEIALGEVGEVLTEDTPHPPATEPQPKPRAVSERSKSGLSPQEAAKRFHAARERAKLGMRALRARRKAAAAKDGKP